MPAQSSSSRSRSGSAVCGSTSPGGARSSRSRSSAAAVVIHSEGSRYGRTAIYTVVVTIAAGEIGVALGVFKSMIPEGTAHGVAAIEATITVLVVMLVTRGQRDTELAQTREKESEERFRALVQYASDAIFVVADGGHVMYASPAVEHVLGCAPEELESFDITWIDPDHADAVVEAWLRLRARPGSVESLDVPIRRVDGTSRWVEVRLTNLTESPAVGGFVCNMRDIGERRDAQAQLMHDAQHDPLTRLPNRRHFLERLDEVWRDDARRSHRSSVHRRRQLQGDQRSIRSRHGRQCARRRRQHALDAGAPVGCRRALRRRRVHGLARRPPLCRRRVRDRRTHHAELIDAKRINNYELRISVSIGVSTSLGKVKSVNDLVRDADQAMYQAKRNGRARWESYEPANAAERSGPAGTGRIRNAELTSRTRTGPPCRGGGRARSLAWT